MTRPGYHLLAAVALACAVAWGPPSTAHAQVPAASPPAEGAAAAYSAADLEKLVGPFALYPDDLVAIILPASTFPLQIVQADRFLDKRKADPKLVIEEGWDDSVKALVNYPDVVKKMSADLDWTEGLGEAVATDSGAVMEAVQAFRRKTQAAGNLKSDKQQNVVVEQQTIKIEQADPQVIYVPQYVPSQVVVSGYVYPYSPPYPVYYYPYAPGAALATGIIWGAAMGAIWNGGRYASHYGGGNNNITINRGNNNINTGNIGSGNRGGGNRVNNSPTGGSTWKSSKQPGQVASAGNRQANSRVGDRPGGGGAGAGAGGRGGAGAGAGAGGGGFGGGAGAANRPSPGGDGGRGGGPSASTRPAGGGGGGGGGGGAFGGMDSGGGAHRASARGQESRGGGASHMSSGGGARAGGGGGGGARMSGGGGGRGGGGGGRGGGGRR